MIITLPLFLMMVAQSLTAIALWYFFGSTLKAVGDALLFPAMLAFVVVTTFSLLWKK
jgi:hypothetical protein